MRFALCHDCSKAVTNDGGFNMIRRKRTLPRGWYPFDGKDCRKEIASYIEGWTPPGFIPEAGTGGIVPHAGWFFSGKLAARVLYCLKSKSKIDAVVLYGGHMGPDELPRIVSEEACETPLGDILIHQDFLNKLLKRVEVKKEVATSGDNTIEVQLAMIKYFFPEVKLVAIRPPFSIKAIELGREIAGIAKEDGISIVSVGSTDLTHYGPNYGFLTKGLGPASVEWVKNVNDKGFVDRALKMDAEGLLDHALKNDSACSAGAAASVIATCGTLGVKKGILLDYYTSYDIMHDDSFVGYAGIVY
jgi:MEMO1 family protein